HLQPKAGYHSTTPLTDFARSACRLDTSMHASLQSVLMDSRFAERALSAELGAGATVDAKVERLAGLAASAWDMSRLEIEFERLRGGRPLTPEVVAACLRKLRRHVLLGVIARDISGIAPLAEVVGTMTALAELAVQRALAVHAQELAMAFGVPTSAAGT